MRPPTSVSPAGSYKRRFRRISNHWVEGHSLLVFGTLKIDPSVLNRLSLRGVFHCQDSCVYTIRRRPLWLRRAPLAGRRHIYLLQYHNRNFRSSPRHLTSPVPDPSSSVAEHRHIESSGRLPYLVLMVFVRNIQFSRQVQRHLCALLIDGFPLTLRIGRWSVAGSAWLALHG